MDFSGFARNTYSLSGEDGILAEIIGRLGLTREPRQRWCVEFGAWDGVFLSNTFHLVKNSGWNAVFIEGDPDKFQDLLRLARKYPRIKPILAYVSATHGDGESLDALLVPLSIPDDFDVLSIDIDSNDIEVWEAIRAYRPKIVVIEVDSSLGPDIVSRYSSEGSTNSFSAAIEAGLKMGYTPVCHTGNVIFVRDDLVEMVRPNNAAEGSASVQFDVRWMKPPTLVGKGRAWLRYRAYLLKRRIGLGR